MMDRQAVLVGVVLLQFVCASEGQGAEDRVQLLATARDANKAAIQAILTMECRFEVRPWGKTTIEQAKKWRWITSEAGRYSRSGDTYRFFEPRENAAQTPDYVVRNGECIAKTVLHERTQTRPVISRQPLYPINGVGGEMWQYLLFSHWGNQVVSYHPFHEILQQPHMLHTVERLPSPSREIHVELSHDGGRLAFWFDPKVNYLVRKSVMIPAVETTWQHEMEVLEFAELAPAVFVPIVIEYRAYQNMLLQAVVQTVLTEVKVNQPLAEDALRIPGIAGMECHDLIRKVIYTVDADGNQTGPERPFPEPDNAPRRSSERPFRPPVPWSDIVLYGLAVALATVTVFVVFRRRSSATQS